MVLFDHRLSSCPNVISAFDGITSLKRAGVEPELLFNDSCVDLVVPVVGVRIPNREVTVELKNV